MPDESMKILVGLNGRQIRLLHILRNASKNEGSISSPVLFKRYYDGIFNTTNTLDKATLRTLNYELADLLSKGLVERELNWFGTRGQKSSCKITDRGVYILHKIYQVPSESEGTERKEE